MGRAILSRQVVNFLEENYEKCDKTKTCQACNNRKKKIFFSRRTKISYKKLTSGNILATEKKKPKVVINKPLHLVLSLKNSNKWYWSLLHKIKIPRNYNIMIMNRDSFKVYIKWENFSLVITIEWEKI